jgi:hypothetical protein
MPRPLPCGLVILNDHTTPRSVELTWRPLSDSAPSCPVYTTLVQHIGTNNAAASHEENGNILIQ